MSLAAAKYRFVTRQRHARSAIHLYRALLRECTYLPDPSSQQYIKEYIRHRFQNAAARRRRLLCQLEAGADEAQTLNAKLELEQALRQGHKGLSQLIRANEGEIKPLMRVLRHTYGRNGPRRYEMMKSLLLADPPSTEAHEQVQEGVESNSTLRTVSIPDTLKRPSKATGENLVFTISDRYSKLVAIASTQTKKNIESHRTRLGKHISIPAKNTWGRPMPRKRVKNMVKHKYAKFLDAILPPLPQQEWLHLQGLAMGTTPWAGCKPRRKLSAGHSPSLSASDLEKLVHTIDQNGELLYLDPFIKASSASTTKKDKIIALAGDECSRGYWATKDVWLDDEDAVNDAIDTVLEDELQVTTLNKSLQGRERGHRITARFMRRLWMEIFKTCPVLLPDTVAGPNKWKVQWGAQSMRIGYASPVNGIEELYGINKASNQPSTTGRSRIGQ